MISTQAILRVFALLSISCLFPAIMRAQNNPPDNSGQAPASKPPQGISQTPNAPKTIPAWDRPPKEVPPAHRFGLGLELSYTPINLMGSGTTYTPATSTAYAVQNWSRRRARPIGVGVNFSERLTTNWSLDWNFLYRRTGFDTTQYVYDSVSTDTFQRTRANDLDLSLLARYQAHGLSLLHRPLFYEAGPSVRRVTGVRTATTVDTTTSNGLGSGCCSGPTVYPAHWTAPGLTMGTGFLLVQDDFGIRVVPELRYTRWLQGTFFNPPTKSTLNQLEIVLSIGW